MVVTIQVENRQAINNVNRITTMFPKAVEKGVNDFGRGLQRNMKGEVTRRKLVWTGKLHKSIRWVKKKNGGELRMSRRGAAVDSMRPHRTWVRRGRKMHRWAMQKGNPGVKSIAQRQGFIFVKPHPFIQPVLQRAIARMPRDIKRRTSRTVNSRGRSV